MNPYNNFYPASYVNPYMQNYQQQQATQMQMQQQQERLQQLQQQNGGYVTVRSEDEARNYPVAPGTSVTFFNETEPFCYKKSTGASPLDPPTFEIYKILKVESVSDKKPIEYTPEEEKSQIGAIFDEIEVLKKRISDLEAKESVEDVKSISK